MTMLPNYMVMNDLSCSAYNRKASNVLRTLVKESVEVARKTNQRDWSRR